MRVSLLLSAFLTSSLAWAHAYALPGVTMALLIDHEGQIVWRGHPGSFDLSTRVAELLMDPSDK